MIISNKFSYLLKIKYNGILFDAFDEMKDKKTVKSVLKEYLLKKGVKFLKGLSQAARTDAKVSANENYIYFQAKRFNMKILDLNVDIEGLKILEVKEVSNNLNLQELVLFREYIYSYPYYNFDDIEGIMKRCDIINETKNFIEFTTNKGKKLLNHNRNIKVNFENGKLYFKGDSFLPQQVRIMSGYILTNKKKSLDAKYLLLNKVILKGEIK